MVKTPEAMRFYALALRIESMLKKKKLSPQERLEVRSLIERLCGETTEEINKMLDNNIKEVSK